MISLLNKELNTFFASLSGYLAIGIFLVATSLFLWMIPGDFNIIVNQQSSMKGFFLLAPWLYLFLIPAITMRMFAEEKRSGTLELLLSRPVPVIKVVLVKYLASLILVTLSLLPTLLGFLSVWLLGTPPGNIDSGATWGSYAGLLFLASACIAIGLFASASTSNQAISFLIAVVLSYLFFKGFETLTLLNPPVAFQNIFFSLSINEHFHSLGRGVIDSRDLFYFITVSFVFLICTPPLLQKGFQLKRVRLKKITALMMILAGLLFLNQFRLFRIDLTAEKRYSLSPVMKGLLGKQDGITSVELFLAGKDLPAGMKSFQREIIEKIEDLNDYSSYRIYYRVTDLYSLSSDEERDKRIDELIRSGIQPVNLGHKTSEGMSTRQIFPGALIQSKGETVALNLLKNNPLLTHEENLQQSVELLEYEFARAIRTLRQTNIPQIAFLEGHLEADFYATGDLRYYLRENFSMIQTTAEKLADDDTTRILIVANPQEPFPEKDKLLIDQFIMKGGKVLWCIDPVFVSIDSLSKGYSTLAFERDLNLRDQLFSYGVRLNSDLLQDVVCLEYPVNTMPAGQSTRFVPAPFYYSPLATPYAGSPVTRNLNNVLTEFVSSVDAVGENPGIRSFPVLTTSPYSRRIQTPVEVSILTATTPPDSRIFNRGEIPIGIALEGEFGSIFRNRMTGPMGIDPQQLITKSPLTKMIIIADGGMITNKVRNRNGQISIQPMGYDLYSKQTFGNRDFIQNCIDYLNDDDGIMQLRSRTVKMRLLDKTKIRDYEPLIKGLNTSIPIIFLILFGVGFQLIRRRIYKHSAG